MMLDHSFVMFLSSYLLLSVCVRYYHLSLFNLSVFYFRCFLFFFFKQKTAYEMRISDWSSDVCSSDLFASEQDLRHHLQHWLETVANARVHGTTGRVPREHFEQEERQHLRSYLSPTSLVLRGSCAQTRRADKTGLISWKSNKYSVPMAWQRANVGVAEHSNDLTITDLETGDTIAVHELCAEKGRTVKNTDQIGRAH